MSKTRTAEKILYLDFDGVLHDEEVFYHPKRGIYLRTPGRVLFEWVSILEALLAPHPDVAIVLSTSWVRAKNFSYAKKQLSPMLQERVIGATFHSREMRKAQFVLKPRGEQIMDDVFRRAPRSWLALDDDYLGWPAWCKDNLILTDGRRGLSDPDIQEAIRGRFERL